MTHTAAPKMFSGDVNRIRTAAEKLVEKSRDFPAVNRNAAQILAGIKMIELNPGDAA
jgi:hypothetical protein